MNKVYVVTSGIYPDYRIVAIFDNKEEAEKLKQKINDETLVEEYPLNSYVPYIPNYVCSVGIKDGQVIMVRETRADMDLYEDHKVIGVWPNSVALGYGDTKESAIKSAADRAAWVFSEYESQLVKGKAIQDIVYESN